MKILKVIAIALIMIILFQIPVANAFWFDATSDSTDVDNTLYIKDKMTSTQPTPTDIDYSLERYNLIRRAYWVNGMREKANSLICPVVKPLGYIVLMTNTMIVGSFVVDGKVSSLNSFLTPDSEYAEIIAGGNSSFTKYNEWLPDVDGSYGINDNGIFFFTPEGNYYEWTGMYIYSDVPFEIAPEAIIISVGE